MAGALNAGRAIPPASSARPVPRRAAVHATAVRSAALRLAALAALIALVPGCAGFGSWARARGRDLGDCARASVSLGAGLHAEAQATSFLHPSAGFGDVSLAPKNTLGWDPRPLPAGRVRTDAFPMQLVSWPAYRREMIDLGYGDTAPGWRGFISPWILMGSDHVEGRSNSLFGLHRFIPNPLLAEPPETPAERRSRQSWIAAGGTLAIIQADAGVNPLEILDFLAGLAGLDPLGDDRRREEPALPPGPPEAEPAENGPPPGDEPRPADPLQSGG